MPDIISIQPDSPAYKVAAHPDMVIRQARPADAKEIQSIIGMYANERLMLPRTLMQIYENLRDYSVAVENETVIGVGALHLFWEDLAEIRALAIAPGNMGRGVGRHIVLHLFEQARELGVPQVFAFTYVPQFFEKLGFEQVPHSSLPLKVWKDCINCSFFNNCNEIAMIRKI
jgi:amino-acid N-acetyltransferase